MGLLKSRWSVDTTAAWRRMDIPLDLNDSYKLNVATNDRARLLQGVRGFSIDLNRAFASALVDRVQAYIDGAMSKAALPDLAAVLRDDLMNERAWTTICDLAEKASAGAQAADGTAQDFLHAARASLALDSDVAQQFGPVFGSVEAGLTAEWASDHAFVLWSACFCLRGARAAMRAHFEAPFGPIRSASIAVFSAHTSAQTGGLEQYAKPRPERADPQESAVAAARSELEWQATWLSEHLSRG